MWGMGESERIELAGHLPCQVSWGTTSLSQAGKERACNLPTSLLQPTDRSSGLAASSCNSRVIVGACSHHRLMEKENMDPEVGTGVPTESKAIDPDPQKVLCPPRLPFSLFLRFWVVQPQFPHFLCLGLDGFDMV